MEREKLVRDVFPTAHGEAGYDIRSVDAHQNAVAAHVAALEARITALEVEAETLRDQLADAREHEDGPSGLPEPGPDPLEDLPPAAPAEDPVAAGEPETEPEPEAAAQPSSAADPGQASARMLATRLAMEGKSRDTIVMQLAAEHDVTDPGALVDDVLARLN